MVAQNHLLVAGASGVIGAGVVEHFGQLAEWRVTALSRRAPVVAPASVYSRVAVDLTAGDACAAAVAALPPVTHLVYAAVAEAPGLVGGWYDPDLIAANGLMFTNLLDPLAASGNLRHVTLLQGTKAYGAHHGHAVEIPAHEDRPRDAHPNFYWLHEDATRKRAEETGFSFTIFRPQVLLGAAPGAAMNPVAALGAYAALTREMGLPFAYPGKAENMWELVDTGLFAEACEWAATTPAAAGQIFNITNGDVFVLAHAWPRLAGALRLTAGEPPLGLAGSLPGSLAQFFAEAGTQAAWARLAERHGLRLASLPALLGESHHYVDLLLKTRLADRPVPMLLSTIKIRHAGFAACRDSLHSLLHWLGRMVELKLLPPFAQIDDAAHAGR